MFGILAAATFAIFSLGADAASASATDLLNYGQVLSPGNSVTSTATGTGTLLFDDVIETIDILVEVEGIFTADLLFPDTLAPDELTFADLGPVHLHLAPAGSNGPLVPQFNDASAYTETATAFRIEATDVPFDITGLPVVLAGEVYIDVHTVDHGSNEIRGQLTPVPVPAARRLSGARLSARGGQRLRRFRDRPQRPSAARPAVA